MESRVTKLVEDVVVVWRRRGGGRATPSFPLLISAVCGCRRGGREGGIFSIAPSSSVPSFVRHRSQFMLLGWGLDGVRSEDEEGAGSRDGSTRTAIEGTPAPPTLVKPIVGDSTV